jgi:hypothetical protein
MKTSKRAEVLTVVLVATAVVALGAWLFKPKILDGESKRAAESTAATAALEAANIKKGATAAASVAVIGDANAEAPGSPHKNFIGQEVKVALANLPAPDPQALLEAEKRKVAVLEGRVLEAQGLYASAMDRASQLEKDRAKALAERQAADLRLERAAAENLGAQRTKNITIFVAACCIALWLWTKFTHLSPNSLAKIVADVKTPGENVLHTIDAEANTLTQALVRRINKLR